ncbi:MAG: hypothetical protein LQ340_006860 [Diploschistes diacapsis]|nr:MAG: hypothetical protein LQ340_006860 [Diploschistes diacapsis]
MATQEQESLFQKWLFFGVLTSFFKSLFKPHEFIRDGSNGCQYVTTAKLIPLMQLTYANRFSYSGEDGLVRIAKGRRVLRHVDQVLILANDDFDWRVKLSLRSVGELLAAYLGVASRVLGNPMPFPPLMFFRPYIPSFLSSRMLSAGWCPSEIAPLLDKCSYFQTLVFFSRLAKSVGERDHSCCTRDLCRVLNIDSATFVAKHALPDCSCEKVSVGNDELRNIILNGGVPLLKIDVDNESARIEIVEFGPNMNYMALSHIWADGLGNPHENALPHCQLRRLATMYKLVHTCLKTSQAGLKDEPFYLWIDTLCCPAKQGQGKDMAIGRLRDTYRNAKCVLVLDAGLEAIDPHDISSAETLLRIFTSAWTRRLWTLQEGVLARTLYFKFKDIVLDYDAIEQSFRHLTNVDIRYLCLGHDLLSQNVWIRQLQGVYGSSANSTGNTAVGDSLYHIDCGLQYRATSDPADEATCLGTLLDLPLEEILNIQAHKEYRVEQARMAKFWELLARKFGGLPQSLVMLTYPKLEVPPFRWAPRTLLLDESRKKENRNVARLVRWTDPRLGRIGPEGLICQWSGYLLKPMAAETLSRIMDPHLDIARALRGPVWFSSSGGVVRGIFPLGAYENPANPDKLSPFLQVDKRARKIDHGLFMEANYAVAMAGHSVMGTSTESMREGLLGTVEAGKDSMLLFQPVAFVTIALPIGPWKQVYNATETMVSKVQERHGLAAWNDLNTTKDKLEKGVPKLDVNELDLEIVRRVRHELEQASTLQAAVEGLLDERNDVNKPAEFLVNTVKQSLLYRIESETLGEDTQWCIG